MVSQLILDFPDTGDVRTLRINDASFYNPDIPVECGTLEITTPGFIEPVIFNVEQGFSVVLNASNLKLAKVKVYTQLQAIPDGIYKVRYSIKPNVNAWVEYDHMRNNTLLKQYYTELCSIKLQPSPASKQVKDRLKRLREIKSYIDVSKIEVDECGNRSRGIELYKYAQELLKVNCQNC